MIGHSEKTIWFRCGSKTSWWSFCCFLHKFTVRISIRDWNEFHKDSFVVYRGDLTTSIICEYSRRDIDTILDGNFKEADSTSFWRELPRDHVPDGVPKNV
jgi:hypothetical protein